jgi:hypothetical protein
LCSAITNGYGDDQANRLTSATVGGATSTYTFAGDGTRSRKVSGGVTTDYAYDANRSLPVMLTEKVSSPAGGTVTYEGQGASRARNAELNRQTEQHTGGRQVPVCCSEAVWRLPKGALEWERP